MLKKSLLGIISGIAITANGACPPEETAAYKNGMIKNEADIQAISPGKDRALCYEEFKPEDVMRIKTLATYSPELLAQNITTPYEAAIFCTHVLKHGGKGTDENRWGGEYWASWPEMLQDHVGDCDDAAVSAVSLLARNGVQTYLMTIDGREVVYGPRGAGEISFGHALCIYKTSDGRYGSVGINKSDIQPPQATSLDEFVSILSATTGYQYNDITIYDMLKAFPDSHNLEETRNYCIRQYPN